MLRISKNPAFTLIELLLVIGIIAVLAAIVILAINPTANIAAAYDAERRSEARVYNRAIVQALIGGENMDMIPTGVENAQEICQYGKSIDCVNLDVLYDSDYIRSNDNEKLPVDPAVILNEELTGYKVYKEVSGIFMIIAPYIGSGSVIGSGGGGGESSSSSSIAVDPPLLVSLTSSTSTWPAGLQDGDLAIYVLDVTSFVPSGWTAIRYYGNIGIGYKVVAAADSTSAMGFAATNLQIYRNAELRTVPTAVSSASGNPVTISAPAIDLSSDEALVATAFRVYWSDGSGTTSFANTDDFTTNIGGVLGVAIAQDMATGVVSTGVDYTATDGYDTNTLYGITYVIYPIGS
jgi:prepilin-type N-terminal cleavage/methylation domain-containing protein